jgi:hypothetical protein
VNPASTASPSSSLSRWADSWPDALAFAGGLAVAWFAGWKTADLVWSLWLSSLLIGYAMIVWMIINPLFFGQEQLMSNLMYPEKGPAPGAGLGFKALTVLGGLFLLAFFTVHFGGFHFVHSVFLSVFFPLNPGDAKGVPGLAFYGEVLQRYWWFLPAAAIAERQAFRRRPVPIVPVTATDDADSKKSQKKAKENAFGEGLTAPYKNVIRLHVLIFFFAFAHFAKLESFLVYAVVYAVYFFPWRLVKAEPVLASAG